MLWFCFFSFLFFSKSNFVYAKFRRNLMVEWLRSWIPNPSLIKWVPGISGDLKVKSEPSPLSGLRQLNLIHKRGLVCIRVSFPLKNTTLSFFQSPPLNWQTVQAPPFLGNPLLYIGFLWIPPLESQIFQWTPKILKVFHPQYHLIF